MAATTQSRTSTSRATVQLQRVFTPLLFLVLGGTLAGVLFPSPADAYPEYWKADREKLLRIMQPEGVTCFFTRSNCINTNYTVLNDLIEVSQFCKALTYRDENIDVAKCAVHEDLSDVSKVNEVEKWKIWYNISKYIVTDNMKELAGCSYYGYASAVTRACGFERIRRVLAPNGLTTAGQHFYRAIGGLSESCKTNIGLCFDTLAGSYDDRNYLLEKQEFCKPFSDNLFPETKKCLTIGTFKCSDQEYRQMATAACGEYTNEGGTADPHGGGTATRLQNLGPGLFVCVFIAVISKIFV